MNKAEGQNFMIEYHKLIRDKIPEIIEKDGSKAKIRILNEEEYQEELIKKIIEEAKEALDAGGDKKELTKEIGDILEIIEALIQVFELDRDEIEKMRRKRKELRGGFDKKLFLEYTE